MLQTISPTIADELFVSLLEHYVKKGILLPAQKENFLAAFRRNENPFATAHYLKLIIRRLKTLGYGPYYLSNRWVDRALFMTLWAEADQNKK